MNKGELGRGWICITQIAQFTMSQPKPHGRVTVATLELLEDSFHRCIVTLVSGPCGWKGIWHYFYPVHFVFSK